MTKLKGSRARGTRITSGDGVPEVTLKSSVVHIAALDNGKSGDTSELRKFPNDGGEGGRNATEFVVILVRS